jgi:hypothetical protein
LAPAHLQLSCTSHRREPEVAALETPDPEMVAYALRFPAELEAAQVTAWLHSLSGLLPGMVGRLFGAPAVVIELEASAEHGFHYQLRVPRGRADYVTGQLRAAVPGIRVEPVKEADKDSPTDAAADMDAFLAAFKEETVGSSPTWTVVAELGMRELTRSLRVEPVPLAGSVLASLMGFALHASEAVLMQWIIRPAVPERPPAATTPRPVHAGMFSLSSPRVAEKDALADQRAKLSAANFLAVLRIGVRAGGDARAKQLLGQVRAALKATGTTANGLYVRTALQSRLRTALDTAKSPLLFSMQLTAAELTGLLAWPIGSPNVAVAASPKPTAATERGDSGQGTGDLPCFLPWRGTAARAGTS